MNVISSPLKKAQQLGEEIEPEVDDAADDEKLTSGSSRHGGQQRLQFYYWDAVSWVEFPMKTNALLGAAFKSNCGAVILPVADSRLYKIDFKNKSQMNLKTGYVRSIAWENFSAGCRAFARLDKPFERQELLPSDERVKVMSESHQQRCILRSKSANRVPSPFNLTHTHVNVRIDTAAAATAMLPSASCPFQSKAVETFGKLGDRVAVLEPGNKEFSAVDDVFSKGFSSRLPPHGRRPRLTAVHKVINSDAKLRYSGEQLRSMEQLRGNANLRHAWHGSSSDAIISIVMYGFGQRPLSRNGSNFGCGTYLAPCSKLDVSAQYCEVDENMEQHVLLCEVMLGESEMIPPGSCHRFLPSSTSYDSGVDDLDNPNLYIIWTPFINSHIIPWYIVSFATEESTQKFSGPMRRSRELVCPLPYLSSSRKTPIIEFKHANEPLHLSSLRIPSKSGQMEILTLTSAALPSIGSPRRENNHNDVFDEGTEICSVKAVNASKGSLQEGAGGSTQAGETTYHHGHHSNKNINFYGLVHKDDKSSISGKINLNLGLNIDGFSHQPTHPKWLAQSLGQQQIRMQKPSG